MDRINPSVYWDSIGTKTEAKWTRGALASSLNSFVTRVAPNPFSYSSLKCVLRLLFARL